MITKPSVRKTHMEKKGVVAHKAGGRQGPGHIGHGKEFIFYSKCNNKSIK